MRNLIYIPLFMLCSVISCAQKTVTPNKLDTVKKDIPKTKIKDSTMNNKNYDIITLGAGCFWCVEAVFQQLKGVVKVESGYAGGHLANPSYEQICTKTTGHAEVCKIVYDTTMLKLDELLEVYWQTHDPTTLNQQGADKGPQYRSVIFYSTDEQKQIAEKYKQALDKSGAFNAPIITAIEAFTNFYIAEEEHQNFYKNNPSNSYCYYVVRPKMEKFYKVFKNKAITE